MTLFCFNVFFLIFFFGSIFFLESRVQSPESRVQTPESRLQTPVQVLDYAISPVSLVMRINSRVRFAATEFHLLFIFQKVFIFHRLLEIYIYTAGCTQLQT